MKIVLASIALMASMSLMAALPLLQYSWHDKTASSQLFVFEDGNILHQEREQYQVQTIPQRILSPEQISELKILVERASNCQVQAEIVGADVGSKSGTIELRTVNTLKIVEGVVRDSLNANQNKAHRCNSTDMAALKDFIFKYTENDMEF